MNDLEALIRSGNNRRSKQPPRTKAEWSRRYRAQKRARPTGSEWIAIDGEGWGVDAEGRQLYRFMVAATDSGFKTTLYAPCFRGDDNGPDELSSLSVEYASGDNPSRISSDTQSPMSTLRPALDGDSALGNGEKGPRLERIPTAEALEWLCWLRWRYQEWCKATGKKYVEPRICGYGMGYDYAHIVLDFPLQSLKDLFHNQDHEAPWVEFDNFTVKLTAGRFQVKRTVGERQAGYADVWDSFRYFQSSFLTAVAQVATDQEMEILKAGKVRRGETDHNIHMESLYTLTECRVLSRLMAQVEDQARKLDLHPTSWYGPGSMAHLALKQQGVKACYMPDEELPDDLINAASRAFVGGRFETNGHGRLPFMMQYDLKSAYPFSITKLPCLAHTVWTQRKGPGTAVDPFWTLYRVKWTNGGKPLTGGWGPWPARLQPVIQQSSTAEGQGETFNIKMLPTWPWEGEAWIWGPEYRAGANLLTQSPLASWEVLESWQPVTTCDCRPFKWVEDWYYKRLAMVTQGDPRQQWLKLILNSLYGKMAQQIGRAKWHSWLWSGMITAHTRAQLLEAIGLNPEAAVMTATDAVYFRQGVGLPISQSLGDWEVQALGKCLIVQSGFFEAEAPFYGKERPRTRGLPPRFVNWPLFHQRWDEVLAGKMSWDQAHVVVVNDPITGETFQIHVGIGLAQLWNKPEKLGCWHDYPTQISFVTDKRPFRWKDPPAIMEGPEWVCTRPWSLGSQAGAEYHAGRGIGEDKYVVMDQPNASEWGEL